jgi:hypothetical protein
MGYRRVAGGFSGPASLTRKGSSPLSGRFGTEQLKHGVFHSPVSLQEASHRFVAETNVTGKT